MAPAPTEAPATPAPLHGTPTPGAALLRATLKGYGATFFNPRPRAGLLLLLGITAAFPVPGLYSFVGALAATFAAIRFRADPLLAHEGLLTFNGALVGFGWSQIHLPASLSLLSLPLLILVAAATVPLAILLFRLATPSRLQLPPLSLPSILALLAAWALLDGSGSVSFSPMPQIQRPGVEGLSPGLTDGAGQLPQGQGPVTLARDESPGATDEPTRTDEPTQTDAHTLGAPSALTGGRDGAGLAGAPGDMGPASASRRLETLKEQWPAWWMALRLGLATILIGVGLSWRSWRTPMYVASGLLIALALGYALEGPLVLFDRPFVLYAAAPLMVAMGAVFVAPCRASVLFGAFAILVAWVVTKELLPALGADESFPLFTIPFALSGWTSLIVARLAFPTPGKGALVPIPLLKASTPEAALTWSRTQRWSRQFWEDMGRLSSHPVDSSDMHSRRKKLRSFVASSKRIVVLSGAGISTDSGIPDFRTGVIAWKKYDTSHFRYERFLNSETSRQRYWEMSQDFYLLIRDASPNQDHFFIAELEAQGKLQCIVTQNVDRLHQKAGNSPNKVVEIHGNELTVSCLSCEMKYSRAEVHEWIRRGVTVPYCHACQGILKPDSVAFGQPMPVEASRLSLEALTGCDLLLVVGTSLEVEPVNYLPIRAVELGARLAIVTLHPTPFDSLADVVVRGRLDPDSLR